MLFFYKGIEGTKILKMEIFNLDYTLKTFMLRNPTSPTDIVILT
jgi:hypothetical protein